MTAHRKRCPRQEGPICQRYMDEMLEMLVPAWVDVWGPPALSFVVPGDPVGYVAAGGHHWHRRTSKAWRWASAVRMALLGQLAQTPNPDEHVAIVGNPDQPGAKLMATKLTPLHIGTVAYFQNGKHPDPENVHKLVKDALFHKVKGGDKWTGGIYLPPLYDPEVPRTEVFVWKHVHGPTILDRECESRRSTPLPRRVGKGGFAVHGLTQRQYASALAGLAKPLASPMQGRPKGC